MSESFTCPSAIGINPPVKTITVTPPEGGIDRVCVENADGYAETFMYFPPGDTESVVQLSTGEPIVAYSVNAEWGELPMYDTLPATGSGSVLIAVAVSLVSLGLVLATIKRGGRRDD